MNLTFRGFLRLYCRELSGLQTDGVKKLCGCAATDAPRLAEPLFLLAAVNGKLDQLLASSEGTWLAEPFALATKQLEQAGSIEAFLAAPDTPDRFKKVRRAFEAKKYSARNDRRIIGLMREKTLVLMRERGLTAYQICKDLDLNLGNIYAYLNKGDVAKVSRATARRILEHAAS